MHAREINPYLKTKVLTASPQELRLMLYEGAIKFCHQAKAARDANDHESAFNGLMKAQKIILELSTSLNHEISPDLCSKLSALYTYIYRRLVDATVNKDETAIDEAIQLLEYERETWHMLMEQLANDNADSTSQDGSHSGGDSRGKIDPMLTQAQQTAISSLSIKG